MIKSPNKIFKLLAVVGILFSIVQLCVGAASAADDTASGSAKEWANKAYKADSAGKYDEAIECADKAIRINPDYAGAYNARGYARYQKKLFKEAVSDYDMTIKLKPDFPTAYTNRGSAKFFLGLFDSCIEDQNTAIKLSPDNGNAYFFRARAYHGKKLYAQAIADYSRALEIEPLASRYSCRADAYLGKGEYDLAVKDIKEAILLAPDNEELKRKLAKLSEKTVAEKPSGAEPAIEGPGVKAAPNDKRVGVAVYAIGRAMTDGEKALKNYLGQEQGINYILVPYDVREFFDQLARITQDGRKINYLIILGHGSADPPHIALRKGEDLRAENFDLEIIKAAIQRSLELIERAKK